MKGNDTASRSSIDIAEEGEVGAAESQNLGSHAAPGFPLRSSWRLGLSGENNSYPAPMIGAAFVEINGNTLVHAPVIYDSPHLGDSESHHPSLDSYH